MISKRPFPRADRLSKALYKEISKIFLFDISDPLFVDLTITAVKLSKDLKTAKIYYVTNDKSLKEKIKKRIPKLIPLVRSLSAKALNFKQMPSVSFVYDDVFEEGFKIDKLIKKVNKE